MVPSFPLTNPVPTPIYIYIYRGGVPAEWAGGDLFALANCTS